MSTSEAPDLPEQRRDYFIRTRDAEGNDVHNTAMVSLGHIPLGTVRSSVPGDFSSDTIDAFAWGMLPGAIMRVGVLTNPFTNQLEARWPFQDVSASEVGQITAPIGMVQGIGRFLGFLHTGPAAASGSQQLVSGTMAFGVDLATTVPNTIFTLSRFSKLRLKIEKDPAGQVLAGNCVLPDHLPDSCLARDYSPSVAFIPNGIGVHYSAQNADSSNPSTYSNVGGFFAGSSQQTIHLNGGVEVDFTAASAGTLSVSVAAGRPEPGYHTASPTAVYTISFGVPMSFFLAVPPIITGPITVHLPTDGIAAGELAKLRVGVPGPCGLTFLPSALSGGKIVFNAPAAGGSFLLVVPDFSAPAMVSNGPFSFTSEGPAAELVVNPPVASQSQIDNIFVSLGLGRTGSVYQLGPTGRSFSPAGVVKFCYNDEEFAFFNGAPVIYQYTADGRREELPGQNPFDWKDRHFVAAHVTSLSSLFGAFGSVSPVAAQDLLPPVTQLSFDRAVGTDAAGAFLISTETLVSLSASDPLFAGAPNSGVAARYFQIDGALPPSVFVAPFSLPPGVHALSYYSVDAAGNQEAVRTVTVVSIGQNPAPRKAFALAADAGGSLWEVTGDDAGLSLSKFSQTGQFVAATGLPDAVGSAWTIRFDASGKAFAVGTASGPATAGADLAVYKVDASGSGLLSRRLFDGGLDNDDFAFDAAGDLWMTGALADVQGAFSLGLWKYSTQDDSLVLKSSYSAGTGLDAGFGIALDASQNIWVVGFSSNDYTQNPNKLDLALWKFDPTGAQLLDGPLLQPGFAQGMDSVLSAKIAVHEGQLVVVAARRNTLGNNDLATLRFDLDGELISQRFWHGAPGADDVPHAMAFDGQGGLFIAGESTIDPVHPALAYWPVDAAGRVFNAQTALGVGAARGIALRGQDTWLAVASSAPYRFLGRR